MAIDPLSGVLALGGFLTGRESGGKVADANFKANQANLQAQKQREGDIKQLGGTSSTEFSSTNINDVGGIDRSQVGGPTAARNRSQLALGDVDRVGNLNRLTPAGGIDFNVKNIGQAQGIVDRDRGANSAHIADAFNAATSRSNQKFDPGHSGSQGALVDALARAYKPFEFNREQEADKFLRASQGGQLENTLRAIAANQLQAPPPGFTDENPGMQVASLLAQTPLAQKTSDLRPAVDSLSGGNLLAQLAQMQAGDLARKDRAATIRQLGDAGAFK